MRSYIETMSNKRLITMTEVNQAADKVADTIAAGGLYTGVRAPLYLYGVPRGGIPAAYLVSKKLVERYGIRNEVTFNLISATVIIDDIYDSGATAARYKTELPSFLVLFDKRQEPWAGQWLIMPWELDEGGSTEDIIIRLLQFIGEDPTREGLRDTPTRVIRAWQEWASGYQQSPAELFKIFEESSNGYDELIIVHNVPVISRCEHHLADIIGLAHVGYIPNKGRIVGLSKLARLVDIFARRLQVQERMTCQIADAIMQYLQPVGAGCIIRAAHSCMSTRGVKIHGSVTSTSAMRGALLSKPEARKEFLDLCTMAGSTT